MLERDLGHDCKSISIPNPEVLYLDPSRALVHSVRTVTALVELEKILILQWLTQGCRDCDIYDPSSVIL